MRRRFEKYVIEGSKYAHRIGLYLSFLLNWVLGPFVHGRLQNLQTSEVTFVHVITPLTKRGRGFEFITNLHTAPPLVNITVCKIIPKCAQWMSPVV